MGIEQLLRDQSIPYVTEGHKHSTAGWVNVHCPFCAGSQDYHLGIHEEGAASHCWRCGSHSTVEALSRVLRLPPSEVKRLLGRYRTAIGYKTPTEPKVSLFPLRFPQPSFPLNGWGHQYLSKRGFDAERVEQEWGLLQTGPVSFLDGISYNHRILIPIYWDRKIVSFNSRDITGKSDRKYLACPMRRESLHHKNILYGKQERWGKGIIIVEGPIDVWRLGPSAVATFGTSVKMEQVLQLARHGERFFIVFDNDPQAQDQARALAVKLRTLGKETHIETIVEGDPGDMKQEDANHFVNELIGGRT